jgi:hypothetical protein
MQESGTPSRGKVFGLPNQPGADSCAPNRWFYEQTIQFGVTIPARQHYGEPDNFMVQFGDNGVAFGYLRIR